MPPISRRQFLALVAAAGAAAACSRDTSNSSGGSTSVATDVTLPPPRLDASPFTLGVASGDPLPDRVVLWTRLAPKPLEGGGMPDQPVSVVWEVATDREFNDVTRRGVAAAETRWGHSVHVDAAELRPDSWYWYRFRVGEHTSPVGRTRTAPARDQEPSGGGFRFGFASCQSYPDGFYTAYPHLVDEQLDLLVWLGDYIYEGDFGGSSTVRKHNSERLTTLDDYRNRYGLYTSDPNLQAARAAQPWIVLWDDHEVENNYADEFSKRNLTAEQMRALRAVAYQAWWENQPVRMDPPVGPDLQIYRTLSWGSLAQFIILDQRQYRDSPICGNTPLDIGDCAERNEPTRSMLGAPQRDWFLGELDRTTATWNVIANEVILGRTPITFGGKPVWNLDQWDGFAAEQQLVIEELAARPALNPLVITGDIHAYGASDLRADWDTPGAPAIGAEFVGGSITSNFLEGFSAEELLREVPWVHYANSEVRGYAVMELTADEARCRFRAVQTTKETTSPISTIAEFIVNAGTPGMRKVA